MACAQQSQCEFLIIVMDGKANSAVPERNQRTPAKNVRRRKASVTGHSGQTAVSFVWMSEVKWSLPFPNFVPMKPNAAPQTSRQLSLPLLLLSSSTPPKLDCFQANNNGDINPVLLCSTHHCPRLDWRATAIWPICAARESHATETQLELEQSAAILPWRHERPVLH